MALETTDPTLRALILSITGDEYGHARSFAVMLTLSG
jgi:rubrerythrin